jgi:hypothetical protein
METSQRRAAVMEIFAAWQRFCVQYVLRWTEQVIDAGINNAAKRKQCWAVFAQRVKFERTLPAAAGAGVFRPVLPRLEVFRQEIKDHIQDHKLNQPYVASVHNIVLANFGVDVLTPTAATPVLVAARDAIGELIERRNQITHGNPNPTSFSFQKCVLIVCEPLFLRPRV